MRDLLLADRRRFRSSGDDLERLFYAWSVFFCLPTGREDQPSAATGTVMSAETMKSYAIAAGYPAIETLPIEKDFWRFCRLL